MPEGNILIADDDQRIRELFVGMLKDENYRIYLAADGKEAVDIAKRMPVDVAILDIMMPEMDGLEALRRIKEIDEDIQIIIHTGYGELESLRQTLGHDRVFDYLIKPTGISAIRDLVHKALKKRGLLTDNGSDATELRDRFYELERDFKERTYQLRESQIKYKDLVENLNDAIIVIQEGYLRFANRTAVQLLGRPGEGLLNAPIAEMIHPYDRVGVEEFYRKRLRGESEPLLYTFRVLRKDGSSLWVESHAVKTMWGESPATLSVMRDITDRIAAQEALRESEEKYRGIFDQATDSIFLVDLETGAVVDFNETAHRSLGYTKEEFQRLTLADIEVLESPGEVRDHMDRLKNEGEGILETKHQAKDGEIRDMELRSKVISLNDKGFALILGRDVTEARRKDEVLRIKDAALATSISGIAFANLEGNVTYVNKSFLRLWGYNKEKEVLGRPISEFARRTDEGLEISQAVRERGGWAGEVTLRKKDGSLFKAQVSVSMVRDELGKPICLMGSFIDMSDQKTSHHEALIRTEKLSSLGQLSAGLAHELRNPLAVISTCSQFCLDNMKLERQVIENFQVIYRSSQRASILINELLDFARPSQLEWAEVDINQVIHRMLDMARLERKSFRITFVPMLRKWLPKVMGDRGKLVQLFLNLTQNAVQAVSEGGKIILQTRFVASEGQVEVNIIDDGPGIPDDYRHRIFDPFFTTKDGGTGLGLSICHSIVEQHEGSISVNSEDEGGTRVSVRLPAKRVEKGVAL